MDYTVANRLQDTRVRNEDGSLLMLHYFTNDRQLSDGYHAPALSSFRTRDGVEAHMREAYKFRDYPDGAEPRVVSAYLAISNPLEVDIAYDDAEHTSSCLVESVRKALPGFLSDDEVEDMEGEYTEDEIVLRVVEKLEMAGYDGLVTRQDPTAPGEFVATIFRPEQIAFVAKYGRYSENKAPYQMSLDDFLGPHMVSDIFDIDGDDENFEVMWEALANDDGTYPLLSKNGAGWEVRLLPDFEPFPSLGLFDPDGTAQGFYMGGMAWINDDARGQNLSSMMILAAAEINCGSPTGNEEGLGYSEAGAAAHAQAWSSAQREPEFATGGMEKDEDYGNAPGLR